MSACIEQLPARHSAHFYFLGFTSVLRPSVSSTGGDVRPMALQCWQIDSDGSPPGGLSIGSTGQEVIHVFERIGHKGNKFTTRVLSSAGISFLFVVGCGLVLCLVSFGCAVIPIFLFRLLGLFSGECPMHPRGSVREPMGIATTFSRVCHHCHHPPADVFVRCSVEPP